MHFIKPCLKRHLHAVADSTAHQMNIGFHYGRERGALIEDIDETQLLLLSLLDGQHPFAEIVQQLQARFPSVTADDVAETLEDLAALSLIEDAAAVPPTELSATDSDRYANQIRFFSILDTTGQQRYALQARLKQARVAVIGLGGLGSNLAIGLAAAGVGYLRIIDGDTVELRNLNRQVLYTTDDIGHAKATLAAEHLHRFNPDIHFDAIPHFIQDADDLTARLQGIDVVALCADGDHINDWMNQVALATGVPFINGGYRGTLAEVGPFVVPGVTGCLMCYPHERQGQSLPEQLAWINEASRLRHPTTYFVSAAAASITCGEIIKHITGMIQPMTYDHMFQLDLMQFALEDFPWPRQATCAACGTLVQGEQQ